MNKMLKLDIEEVKRIQLQILADIHKYCENNDIEYFLPYGTLIGAIRHNGYIPWDDDIDICMTRPNYDRFINEYNGTNPDYLCVSFEYDQRFLYTFAKVMDKNTVLIENTRIKYNLGVNIDVFPIDGINDDVELLKKQIHLKRQSDIKSLKLSKKRHFLKNLVLIAGRVFLFAKSHKKIIQQMVRNATLHKYELAYNICCVSYGSDIDKPFPKKSLEERCLCVFEDGYYYIPAEYDSYLRSLYEDYMALPPEEKRVTHHSYTAYRPYEQ